MVRVTPANEGEAMKTRKYRNILIQVAFFGCLVSILGGFALTANHNLVEQGITSGFGFLERSTGWDPGFTLLEFSIRDPYWWTMLIGLTNTVVVGYIAMALATFLGVFLAVMRISNNPVLSRVALVYIDIIRNVPPILQVLAWYALFSHFPAPRQALQFGDHVFLSGRGLYIPTLNIGDLGLAIIAIITVVVIGLIIWISFAQRFFFTTVKRKLTMVAYSMVTGIVLIALTIFGFMPEDTPLVSNPVLKGFNFQGGLEIAPEFTTILVATMVYGSAYVAEIVRGGFLSVDRGKIEAGRALGLSPWVVFTRIQLPLTVQNIMPMMTNLYVWLIKATTLGIAVGFADMFAVTVSSINQSGQTLEFILLLAVAFWVLNGLVVFIMNRLNDRMQAKH